MCSCQATSAESRVGLFAIFHNRLDQVEGEAVFGFTTELSASNMYSSS